MSKNSSKDRKITTDEIEAIDLELNHIENLIQLLIPELPADNDQLDSGLMLIDNQTRTYP